MDKPPRSPTENLVSPWTFVRWMVVGFYVGFATVTAFAFWYMYDNVLGIDLSQDGHSTVTWQQLTNYGQCSQWEKFQVSFLLSYIACIIPAVGGMLIRVTGTDKRWHIDTNKKITVSTARRFVYVTLSTCKH